MSNCVLFIGKDESTRGNSLVSRCFKLFVLVRSRFWGQTCRSKDARLGPFQASTVDSVDFLIDGRPFAQLGIAVRGQRALCGRYMLNSPRTPVGNLWATSLSTLRHLESPEKDPVYGGRRDINLFLDGKGTAGPSTRLDVTERNALEPRVVLHGTGVCE